MSKILKIECCQVKQEAECYKVAFKKAPLAHGIARANGLMAFSNCYYILFLPKCEKCESHKGLLLVYDFDNEPAIGAIKKKNVMKLLQGAEKVPPETLPQRFQPSLGKKESLCYGDFYRALRGKKKLEYRQISRNLGNNKFQEFVKTAKLITYNT